MTQSVMTKSAKDEVTEVREWKASRDRGLLRKRIVAGLLASALVVGSASPAFADRYEKTRAGHPLRIAAYIVYPIGALLDVLIMRPAHWLGSQEPFKSTVNHED